jgi:hypothetical protein
MMTFPATVMDGYVTIHGPGLLCCGVFGMCPDQPKPDL